MDRADHGAQGGLVAHSASETVSLPLTLKQKLEAIKLSEEGTSKAEMGPHLGLCAKQLAKL